MRLTANIRQDLRVTIKVKAAKESTKIGKMNKRLIEKNTAKFSI